MTFSVSRVQWEQAAPLLKIIRERVFVCERRIPKQVEFDRRDHHATHILVCDDYSQEPIATGRIFSTGEISRIAVIPSFRKHKVDKLILNALLIIAKEHNLNEVFIYSPLDAVQHFRDNNFIPSGAVFMEAGMPKQRVVCSLEDITDTKVYLSH
ncbi:GNAT family N-acetyltransferase [Thalassotalea piscium]|uniref:Putative GNAT family N-acyltransferase n=1 Tax=Thalassotalea piscium TaxID=1230533 RepID=A0A7X0NH19_9GAMM|nr:GNAT family N-acetyltransferase [Thalassotalea piscium]MBB6543274.1 putative GNAT family N-acyltransferase [Thalassotalea piscium]